MVNRRREAWHAARMTWLRDRPGSLDPRLVGIWLLPGQPQTYEITADGGYHIADPEEPLAFEAGGEVMLWGGRRYLRATGAGATPIGTWREEETGDGWDFEPGCGLTILSGDPVTDAEVAFVGIWALRHAGRSLWTCEKRAELASDGRHLTYSMVTGETYRYGYSVEDGVLCLLDPSSGTELTRYIAADRYHAAQRAV